MASPFTETIFQMVARHELTSAQALSLIAKLGPIYRDSAAKNGSGQLDIAIVGIAGRFPGATDPAQFWDNLAKGDISIAEVPPERWDIRDFYDPRPNQPGKTNCKWAGLLADIDKFDPLFFNISPKEAALMDPQQRLFLETAWSAVEDAGMPESRLSNSRCGVFVGVGAGDYAQSMLSARVTPDAYAFMGNSPSILAARIAYALNLKGPAIAVDTACSSSLVALHLACESIANGTSDLAIAGGVCVLTSPNFFIAAAKAGMLSPTGRCRAFDHRADGFIAGEAVGAVVLKPLAKARDDGDFIYAVIKGSAINQDGRTNGITAPSATSQSVVETAAYERAGVNPATIGHVEAHGTGTRLGDPIEVEALTRAFRAHTAERQFCSIGSVKANIGHTMTAAGMAGLIKVLLAMKHRQLPPAASYEQENEAIGFEQTPFYVSRELRPWRPVGDCSRLRAAISSFGFSGTNAHVVIEEAPAKERKPASGMAQLIPLSAKSDSSLRKRFLDLANWIDRDGAPYSLDDISYTLAAGRNHFEVRAATVVDSKEELAEMLRAVVRHDTWTGWFVSANTGLAGAGEPGDGNLRSLAIAYAAGKEVDWTRLYENARPSRVPLPTYPFERKTLWFTPVQTSGTAWAHPLLGRKSAAGAFTLNLRRSDPFLRDHVVNGRSILPGVCYLEMARATAKAANIVDGTGVISRPTWLTPLVVQDGEAEIALRFREQDDGTAFEVRSNLSNNAVHCLGILKPLRTENEPRHSADLAAIRKRCQRTLEAKSLYQTFASAGVDCGPFCQGVKRLWVGDKEAIAEIGHSDPSSGYVLHPTLMDAAFQTAMALISASAADRPSHVMVPFSADEVRILRTPAAESYAWVRVNEIDLANGLARFDIDILDGEGEVSVTIKDLCAKEYRAGTQSRSEQVAYYKPVWTPAQAGPIPHDAGESGSVLVFRPPSDLGFTAAFLKALGPRTGTDVQLGSTFRKLGPNSIEIDHRSQRDFERVLSEYSDVEEIIFAGLQDSSDSSLAFVEPAQELGVLSLFRLAKALPVGRRLTLKVISNNVHRITPGDTIFPFTGGIAGLAKTIAREFEPIQLSSIEFSRSDFERNPDLLIQLIRAESGSKPGEEVAFRDGRRYTRSIRRIDLPSPAPDELPIRKQGVYLIVGGAGGIGLTVARHLASNWQARLMLIGRSARDSRQKESIEELRSLGATVEYCQADVTDLDGMQGVVAETKQLWGGIHGVIHSAIVLKDRSIRRLDETTFRDVLAPKVRGAAVLEAAVAKEDLDFFLFFSSANSIFGNAGQGNYAAASTFEDTFALHLNHEKARPAKVINWGYWGEVGIVSSAEYQERINKLGVGSIKSNEGIQALEAVLASASPQIMPIKIDPDLFSKLGIPVISESASATYDEVTRRVENRAEQGRSLLEQAGTAFEQIEQYARNHLVEFFDRAGLLQPSRTPSKNSLREAIRPLPKYEQLLDGFVDILCREGIESTRQRDARERIRASMRRENPSLVPFLELIDACFASYGEVLSGARLATDVLFPKSSTALVENLYKHNAISDYYNSVIAEAGFAAIESLRIGRSREEKIRIIEIGAGTGGATERLLERIQAHAANVVFWYTDLSPALVQHGQRTYGSRYEFLQARTLDIERSPASQGFHEHSFDIVVASNVLHATRDIAQSTLNAARLLKPGGLLILNEATALRDFPTLTFGLTDGWWLFQDPERRLTGSPLLDLRRWRDVLGAAGFTKFRAFPHGVPGRPQSVMIAELDEAAPSIESSIAQPAVVRSHRNDKPNAAVPADRTRSFIEETIKSRLCAALNLSPGDIRRDKRFAEYGVDSIIGVDLVNEINNHLGTNLRTTILFDYSTISELTDHVISEYPSREVQPTPEVATEPKPPMAKTDSIAIVGMSGRFPGAPNIDSFWDNLASGRSAASDKSAQNRWGAAQLNGIENPWGCFLEDIDQFDPLFFNMSGKDAELTDPQQRLFLEEAWKAFEDAGYSDRALNSKKCGVFVGVGPSDYTHKMIAEGVPPDPRAFVGNASSILASRISYFLNLKGPSVAIDTACSSSLVAVHLACQSLLTRESDLALAGGVFISTSPGFQILTNMAGMLSPEGKCKAFDDSADGFVPGEAVAAVVLKRLEDAIADGDQIYGVIRGSGVNQDGRTNGITAPSSISQSELEIDVYQRSGIDPSTITYIETHGTGTKLGDPVEFEALTRAFRKFTSKQQFCAIGSVKTNIGHCSTAAGVTGLIKVLLSLKHGQLPPSLHFNRPNTLIRFEDSLFYVNTQLSDWRPRDGAPRRAAISSFGLSGTNTHIVIEEVPAQAGTSATAVAPYHLATISAKTEDALKLRIRDLQRFLLQQEARLAFSDICYTLNAGRSHFPFRVAIVAKDRADLLTKLEVLARDGRDLDCITRLHQDADEVDPQRIAKLEALIAGLRDSVSASAEEYRDRLVVLADYYVHLYDIEWESLYERQGCRRVSLPTYPFSREKYWLPKSPNRVAHLPMTEQPRQQHTGEALYYYCGQWQASPVREHLGGAIAPANLVLFDGDSGIAAELGRKLAAAGHRTSIIVVRPGERYQEDRTGRSYTVRPGWSTDYETLLASLESRGIHAVHFAHCWRFADAINSGDEGRTLDFGIYSITALSKALLARKGRAKVLFLHPEQLSGPVPHDEAVAGYSASLAMLNPELRLITVQMDANTGPSSVASAIASELLLNTASGQDEIRYAGPERFVHRIQPVDAENHESPLPIRSGGVYLITGGCGAIGSLFAKYLARRHAAKLVLTGRSALSAEKKVLLSEIETLGGRAIYLQADVGDESQMREVIAAVKAAHGRLDGVIHAAGLVGGKPLNEKGRVEFDSVLLPKVRGAIVLDSLTKDENLALFALFSSIASVLGDFGQCDYAVGSRFLDAFAEQRERLRASGTRSGKTVSIGWPLWESGGTHFSDGGDRFYLQTTGLAYLTEAKGIQAFERALSIQAPHVLVLDGDRKRIEKMLRIEEEIKPSVQSAEKPDQLAAMLETRLRGIFADCLRIDATRLGRDTNFSEFGVDSIAVKDITGRLNRELNLDLTPTVLFANSTIFKLASHLNEQYGSTIQLMKPASPKIQPPAEAVPQSVERRQPIGRSGNEPIAIIGASGRFPQSRDLDEFWQHLVQERDLITEVPPDRWKWQDFYAGETHQGGKSVSRWGGFMDDIDKFDAAFFHISPREAAFMDPQHRLVLETAWKTFEDAGYRPSSFSGRRVGVYIGAQFNEYMGLIGDAGEARAQAALGSTHTMLANRVSYFLDFRGPSEVVDTACSSALVAIHRAVQSIQSGECELALAGGVSLMLSPETFVLASHLGMLSPDGRCKTFDKRANGYVKGEGVGTVLLKPLDKAIADGDHIYAVIRGTAENHGGKANSLTAPNPSAQTELLVEAYKKVGVDPGAVTYIEAHGTGTELGDPIEIEALTDAFRRLEKDSAAAPLTPGQCGLGSVKTNVGHLEPAAGIASLMKVMLALQHQKLPATLHVEEVNPYIRLERTPFYLVTKTKPWVASTPRVAGVSSFGFGGSNAHIVLEEHADNARQPLPSAPQTVELILLSAKSEDRLLEYARALREWVTKTVERSEAVRLGDVAFTLQVGREPMEERVAVITDSLDDLVKKLDAFLAGRSTNDVLRGVVGPRRGNSTLLDGSPEAREFIRATVANRRLDRLASLWVEGADIDWSAVHQGEPPQRLSLPTYPFARQRHWVDRRPAISPTLVEPLAPPVPAPEPQIQVRATNRVNDNARAAAIKEKLRAMLAAALYMEPDQIDDGASFSELGLDSILAVELVGQLNNEFGTEFKATRLYDYSNLNELSAFLARAIDGEIPLAATQASSVTGSQPNEESLATTTKQKLREIFASVLGLQTADIDTAIPFGDLGVDFVLAAEATQAINEQLGTNLISARLYEFSSIADLALHIESSRTPRDEAPLEAPASAHVTEVIEPQRRSDWREGIAIIGMSGRFPNARNVDEFWENLARGHDSVTEVPLSRWDVDKHFNADPTVPGTTYSRWSASLEDIDKFDPLFFGIPPRDAEIMEPQQRIFLEEAWRTFEDAGYSSQSLNNTRCAVFAGVGQGDYYLNFPANDTILSAQMGMGNVPSILAARIAYFLNLKGAAVPIDTACSSSLVAMHLGCRSLLNGEADLALAGGICVLTTSRMHIITSQARMLSPEGKCKTFDNSADGFVPGEAVGLVLLKRLSDAVRDGDHIYGVIRGSGMNQDGKTNGITAPSTLSQTALELSVYEAGGIDPDTITFVEAHGTGTKLGDPIEIEALTEAFRKYTDRNQYCAIGSVKTNIGHTLFAAGVAGVIKVLLSLKHRQIPPSLNYETPNEHIDFKSSPFFVNTKLQPWDSTTGVPRRAAVSSFGWSGTNTHLVIEEAPSLAFAARTEPRPYYLANISAKTRPALEERLRDLLRWLRSKGTSHSAESISFTLNCGRTHFGMRASFVFSDPAALAASIDGFLSTGSAPDAASGKQNTAESSMHSDNATALLEDVRRADVHNAEGYKRQLMLLAERYAAGADLDWSQLYSGRPRRIPLPTYPFARRACWVAQSSNTVADGRAGTLHPLLDECVPSLSEALFQKAFRNTEPVLAGHIVQERAILPGVAYLEMARAAAAAVRLPGDVVVLRNVTWRAPLAVDQSGMMSSVKLVPKSNGAEFSIRTNAGDKDEVHCTGEVELSSADATATEHLDITAILSRCKRKIDGPDIYAAFESRSIHYGRHFRALDSIHAGAGESLGTIRVEEDAFRDPRWKLHPAVLDAALQSVLGLLLDQAGPSDTVMLPFSVEEVRIFGETPRVSFAYATRADTSSTGSTHRFNILLADQDGQVVLKIREFTVRPIKKSPTVIDSTPELAALRPVWKRVPAGVPSLTAGDERILILRNEFDLGISKEVRRLCGNVTVHEVLLGKSFRKLSDARWEIDHRSQSDFNRLLQETGPVSSIYFLGGLQERPTGDLTDLETSQQLDVFSLFRLVKALTRADGARLPSTLKVVMNDVNSIRPDDEPYSSAASLTGFTKVLVQEYPRIRVAVVDVRAADLRTANSDHSEPLVRALIDEPGGQPVPEVAYRDGQRYIRQLEPVDLSSGTASVAPLRYRGVYLIAGGAGGIGFATARWLASQCCARIVLLGRSPLDDRKREQIREIEAAGGEALYCQADLTNPDAVRAAVKTARDRWRAIHGVIQSTIVLNDSTIGAMDERGLRVALDPKVNGSFVLATALEGNPLDFMAFFSSSISFTGGPGQANYAAASTFEDAFAASLRQNKRVKTFTINWGYWGEVGVVATAEHRKRAASLGVGSISPLEGMGAFEQVLGSGLDQVAVIKVAPPILEKLGVDVSQLWMKAPEAQESVVEDATRSAAALATRSEAGIGTAGESFALVERYAQYRLLGFFRKHAGLGKPGAVHAIEDMSARLQVVPKQRPLFSAFLDILHQGGLIQRESGRVIPTEATKNAEEIVETLKAQLSRSAEIRPVVDLIDACVPQYHAVLSGARSGASVLFPSGSTALTEAVYAGNRFADFYNELAAECVRSAVQGCIERNGNRVRVLEIGAGTGGTSVHVLKALQDFSNHLEYCYSDLSPAFLRHGREQFAAKYGFTTFRALDIERPPEEQGFDIGSVDIVVASNVLHATRRVAIAVENVKRVLKENGLLVLNETNSVSDFSIMTFGLTDGWWLFEDADIRQPNSPFLSYRQWERLLAESGFRNIAPLGVRGDSAGQSVVVCESDGWIVRRTAKDKPGVVVQPKSVPAGVNGHHQLVECPAEPGTDLTETARRYLTRVFVELLKLQEAEIDDNATFETYGIDSLIGLEIVNRLEADIGALAPTVMFEHSSISALAGYLASNKAAELQRFSPPRNGLQRANGHAPAVPAHSLLTPVRPSGDGPATFWIHGLLGETNWVLRLGRHLPSSFRVYGLRAAGLDGKAQPHSSVEEMALCYMEAIRSAQPRGPYVLGGYSSGGTIAFELAHLLRDSGEPVSHLFFLDSYAPGSAMIESLFNTSDETWLLLAIGNLFALQWKADRLIEPETLAGRDREQQLRIVTEHLKTHCAQQTSAFHDLSSVLRNMLSVAQASGEAFQSYEPRPYPGELNAVLLRCEGGLVGETNTLNLPKLGGDRYESDNGWSRWLSAAPAIIPVPGDHFSMGLEPGIQIVADHIASVLNRNAESAVLAANGQY